MSNGQQIPGQQIRVPVLQAPAVQKTDVSSGLYAAADAAATIQKAQQMRYLNDAQIGAAKSFRELDDKVRRLPWDQKVQAFEDGAAQIRATHLDSLSDGEVKQAFSGDFERMYGSYQVHTKDDAFSGERSHAVATAEEATDGLARDMAFARTPQEREMAKGNLAKTWTNLVQGGFIDENQARQQISKGLSANDAYTAKSLIDSNPWEAKKRLADPANFKFLDPLQIESLRDEATRQIKSKEQEARANQLLTQQEHAVDAAEIAQSDLLSRRMTGKGVTDQKALETLKLGLSPKQFERYQAEAAQADMIFQATGDMRKLPNSELAAAVERLRPQGGETDYAPREAAHQAAMKIADRVINERKTDPGQSVRDSFDRVGTAWRIYETSGQPANLMDALKASEVAQKSLGITNPQNLMPATMAQNIAASIKNAPPQQAAAQLQKVRQDFGRYWPQAFSQMQKFLDANTKVAATLDDPAAASRLIDASRVPIGDLQKVTGVKPTEISEAIAPYLSDLNRAMAPYGLRNKGAIDIAKATETHALGLMAGGMDKGAAVETAVRDIIGKYQSGSVNGQTFMAPKEVNIGNVERDASLVLRNFDLSKVDKLPPPPGMTEKDYNDQIATGLRNGAYWVTAPGMNGLTLFGRNGAITSNGRPLTMSWEEIAKQAETIRSAGVKAQQSKDPSWRPIGGGKGGPLDAVATSGGGFDLPKNGALSNLKEGETYDDPTFGRMVRRGSKLYPVASRPVSDTPVTAGPDAVSEADMLAAAKTAPSSNAPADKIDPKAASDFLVAKGKTTYDKVPRWLEEIETARRQGKMAQAAVEKRYASDIATMRAAHAQATQAERNSKTYKLAQRLGVID